MEAGAIITLTVFLAGLITSGALIYRKKKKLEARPRLKVQEGLEVIVEYSKGATPYEDTKLVEALRAIYSEIEKAFDRVTATEVMNGTIIRFVGKDEKITSKVYTLDPKRSYYGLYDVQYNFPFGTEFIPTVKQSKSGLFHDTALAHEFFAHRVPHKLGAGFNRPHLEWLVLDEDRYKVSAEDPAKTPEILVDDEWSLDSLIDATDNRLKELGL